MEAKDHMDGERITRETLPTISFTGKVSHVRWIAEEAIRRRVSKSEVIRDALDAAKAAQQEAEAA